MICCSSEIEAWVVKYIYHGMASKMICLDKVKADAYAVQYGGVISAMYCPIDVQPSKVALDGSGNIAPWDGETEVGSL